MKKLIIAAALAVSLLSCKKENAGVCWKCVGGAANGVQYPDKDVCNDGTAPVFRDSDGNYIPYGCTRK